jgi:hypothetical protein
VAWSSTRCNVAARPTTRAGARLLQAELSAAASQLQGVEGDGRWWVFYDTSLPSWDAYRGVLSAQLDRDA